MYRVVLIDDERLIAEGLRRVVKWEEYGCAVAGTAEDAEKGAALVREVRPHILFTDIRMPGQDGLTMLAGLRSEFPDMQVTVLTGYRDFSYAQEAIRLGVTRFLLKPSKMDEICEALRAMTDKLAQSAGAEDEEEDGAGKNAGSFIVRQATAYMEEHYAEKLTLQSVADHCYVSQWHLSKLLNHHAGKSFYDVLNSIRVKAAQTLLADPSLKIADIGDRVGYADTAHFARVFKRVTGMSANEYRNTL
ncbi:MAG: response regulator [Ruminococcaceae bacterium]|nr:response regulator [Oscillospiraceae bacterium]